MAAWTRLVARGWVRRVTPSAPSGLRDTPRWVWALLLASWRKAAPPAWAGVKWAAGWALIGLIWVVLKILGGVLNWAWDTWPKIAWSIVGGGAFLWAVGWVLVLVAEETHLLDWLPWVRRSKERLAAGYGTWHPVAGDQHKHDQFEHAHRGGLARHKHDRYGAGDPEPVTEGPKPPWPGGGREPASFGPWSPVAGDRHKHNQYEHSHPNGATRHKHYGGYPSRDGSQLYGAGDPVPEHGKPVLAEIEPEPPRLVG
jgi:hypothetical protein